MRISRTWLRRTVWDPSPPHATCGARRRIDYRSSTVRFLSGTTRLKFTSLWEDQRCKVDRDDHNSTGSTPFSSLAMNNNDYFQYSDSLDDRSKHCNTCTCEKGIETKSRIATISHHSKDHNDDNKNEKYAPCGEVNTKYDTSQLPDPLPEPKYSVRRRLLQEPRHVPLDSPVGTERLIQALSSNTARSYLKLTQHHVNQSEPAFCGITTALIALNTLGVECSFRWRGGWRYWQDEAVLFSCCSCLSHDRVERAGITMVEFQRLLKCQGVVSELKRPPPPVANESKETTRSAHARTNDTAWYYAVENFRNDVAAVLQSNHQVLVTSFSRAALGQTGDGHFSPLGAYHKETDSVLILDVARYKYPSYWVQLEDLYNSMRELDSATKQPRGWLINTHCPDEKKILDEERRPAHLVPLAGHQPHPCPVHPIQVQYCKNNKKESNKT